MSKPTSRLGRGLSTLIPVREPNVPVSAATPASLATDTPLTTAEHSRRAVHELPVDKLVPNPRQPRTSFRDESLQELADSIRSNGVLQPVLVRNETDGKYELVAGERRWRAAKLAGLSSIPAIVRELSDSQSFELALVENLQREDLGPLERAAAYQHYLDAFGGTIEDLAQRVCESRANVSNYLRLLKLRPEICYMLGAGELAMGQARAVAGVNDPQRQLAIAKLAARRNLSVRQVEELARKSNEPTDPAPENSEDPAEPPTGARRHLGEVETSLGKALGMRVRLHPGRHKNSGRLVIHYHTLEEFDRLAERLGGAPQIE